MLLTPREQEKLLIVMAGDLARRRQARGLKLNYPEAVALISAYILEAARDGTKVEQVMIDAASLLTEDDVMDGVATLMPEVQVEATFPDGTKLVTVHDPIAITRGTTEGSKIPGEYLIEDDDIVLNQGRQVTEFLVQNQGDRPVQVGSHYHFFEVNPALMFDRQQAFGKRLAIAAGTAVRFEPGDQKTVKLVSFGGSKRIYGHRGEAQGELK